MKKGICIHLAAWARNRAHYVDPSLTSQTALIAILFPPSIPTPVPPPSWPLPNLSKALSEELIKPQV